MVEGNEKRRKSSELIKLVTCRSGPESKAQSLKGAAFSIVQATDITMFYGLSYPGHYDRLGWITLLLEAALCIVGYLERARGWSEASGASRACNLRRHLLSGTYM